MTASSTLIRWPVLLSCLLSVFLCDQVRAAEKKGGELPINGSIEAEVEKGPHTWSIPAKAGQKFRVRITAPGPVGMHGGIRVVNGQVLVHSGAGFHRNFDLTSEPSPVSRPLELRVDFNSPASVTVRVDLVEPGPAKPKTRLEELKERAESLRRELKDLEREIADLQKK